MRDYGLSAGLPRIDPEAGDVTEQLNDALQRIEDALRELATAAGTTTVPNFGNAAPDLKQPDADRRLLIGFTGGTWAPGASGRGLYVRIDGDWEKI